MNYEKLINLFRRYNVIYEEIEHIEEGISAKIAEIRGNKPEEGCKSILLRWKKDNEKGYILIDVPGNFKVDIEKVKVLKLYKEIRMADVNELMKELGCKIGEVPPFGELFEIETLFDKNLLENEYLYFNAARLDKSIKIKVDEIRKIIEENEKYLITNIAIKF